jgi:uncharacterized membrane protein (DUF485 family)
MKIHLQRNQLAIATSVILSMVVTLCLVFGHDGSHLNPDTAQALSVARNIQQGNGLATSIIYYDEHYRLSTWPAPQTVFPLGFPILISALGLLGVPLRLGAFLMNAFGFLIVPPLIAKAALRMGRQPATALLLAVIWLCFPMNWGNVEESQSDMLFTALTLASFLLLQYQAPTRWHLLLSGLCAAAAFSLRYAGIFWLLTVGLMSAVTILQRRRFAFKQAVVFFAVPATTVLVLFLRNQLLVGDIKGGNNNSSGQPFAFAVMEAYYCLSRITGLDQDALFRGNTAEILFTAGFTILLYGVARLLRQIDRSRLREMITLRVAPQSAAALYVVVSVVTLIWLETTTSIHLSPRMFLPVIPFGLLWAAQLIGCLRNAYNEVFLVRKLLIPLAAGMIVIGLLAGQIASTADVASQVHRFGLVQEIAEMPLQDSFRSVDAKQLLNDSRILTNEPHMLAEYLERGVIGLTDQKYTSQVWTEDAVVHLIQHYDVNQVVFFPDLPSDEENPFFTSLRRFDDGHEVSRPWLKPVLITSRIQIYAVCEPTFSCTSHHY